MWDKLVVVLSGVLGILAILYGNIKLDNMMGMMAFVFVLILIMAVIPYFQQGELYPDEKEQFQLEHAIHLRLGCFITKLCFLIKAIMMLTHKGMVTGIIKDLYSKMVLYIFYKYVPLDFEEYEMDMMVSELTSIGTVRVVLLAFFISVIIAGIIGIIGVMAEGSLMAAKRKSAKWGFWGMNFLCIPIVDVIYLFVDSRNIITGKTEKICE